MKSFLRLDNATVWPIPRSDSALEAEYRLRHWPDRLTSEDRMLAASIIAAYRALIEKPQRDRNLIAGELKKAQKIGGPA